MCQGPVPDPGHARLTPRPDHHHVHTLFRKQIPDPRQRVVRTARDEMEVVLWDLHVRSGRHAVSALKCEFHLQVLQILALLLIVRIFKQHVPEITHQNKPCLLYTSPSPRDS
eukprot:TRINITY_DN584_c0_g2_i4.p1 TRINITY_DN584_c0_g2~~TRINITY_DN584_c0_g2_i4.p1  ORF type:complete len:112 (+),score=8.15 TRINITY_DN584_c0_g2_i4:180-515(+)